MIFHCAADPDYFKLYYKLYYQSIKHYCNSAEFSLHLVGKKEKSVNDFDIKILSREKISFDEIKKRYSVVTDKDAMGFYAFARWTSLPDVTEPLVVSDVDIAAINSIDSKLVNDILLCHDVIQITRITKDDSGGVVMFILHPDIIAKTRNFAREHLKNSNLTWDLDLGMLKFFLDNYKVYKLLNLREVTKNGNLTDEACWFIYSKGKERKHMTLHTTWKNYHRDTTKTPL
jgi:hypothetical protein